MKTLIEIEWKFVKDVGLPQENGEYFLLLDMESGDEEYEIFSDMFTETKGFFHANEDYVLAWSKMKFPVPSKNEVDHKLGRTE